MRWLLLFCLLAGTAMADEVPWLKELSESTFPAGTSKGQWGRFGGLFHFVIVHMPIGLVIALFILELYGRLRRGQDFRIATRFLAGLTMLTAWISVVTGWMLSASYASAAKFDTLEIHILLALSFAVLMTIVWISKWRTVRTDSRSWRTFYGLFLFVALVLVGLTGHFGGELTHRETWVDAMPDGMRRTFGLTADPAPPPSVPSAVVENAPVAPPVVPRAPVPAPAPARQVTDVEPPSAPPSRLVPAPVPVPRPAPPPEREQVFNVGRHQKIPVGPAYILKTKCFTCHGPNDPKGFRMDTVPNLIDSRVIVPYNPDASLMVQVMSLPPSAESGPGSCDFNGPASRNDVVAIRNWISRGASPINLWLDLKPPE